MAGPRDGNPSVLSSDDRSALRIVGVIFKLKWQQLDEKAFHLARFTTTVGTAPISTVGRNVKWG
jgi:hypothetical protein